MMPLGHLGIPLLLPLLGRRIEIDVRLLIIGALLPDLIDKPLGHLILPENNGRIFAHTLIFAFSIFILGLLWRPGMSLSIGVSMHQLQDGMFLDSTSSLWPFLGPFESYDFEISQWFEALTEPYVISEEIVGSVLIITFILAFKLHRPENLLHLLKKGNLRGQK